jgi:hypothetical protein
MITIGPELWHEQIISASSPGSRQKWLYEFSSHVSHNCEVKHMIQELVWMFPSLLIGSFQDALFFLKQTKCHFYSYPHLWNKKVIWILCWIITLWANKVYAASTTSQEIKSASNAATQSSSFKKYLVTASSQWNHTKIYKSLVSITKRLDVDSISHVVTWKNVGTVN